MTMDDLSKSSRRDASSESQEHRRGSFAASTGSSTNRPWSMTSAETGDSSKWQSSTYRSDSSRADDSPEATGNGSEKLSHVGGRASHKSHRGYSSGGFLLSDVAVELSRSTPQKSYGGLPTGRPEAGRDRKGKMASKRSSKKHKHSDKGLSIGGSPLAANVTNAGIDGEDLPGNDALDSRNRDNVAPYLATPSLDVDSKQIVNLALNLSESRRARRNVSSSIQTPLTGFSESLAAGGSLKQHLQQQRRSSRNASPKSDHAERSSMGSPRPGIGRLDSLLQDAFNATGEDNYQYHFSASTLARADKAKNVIGLMAQYRRLLQYLPPLKPQTLSRTGTYNSEPGSPDNMFFPVSRTRSSTISNNLLGRPYNPLQYIRNRKVRRREQRAINGEAEGFGNLDDVSSWVDQISQKAASSEYYAQEVVLLPPLKPPVQSADPGGPSQASSDRKGGMSTRASRPRIDWSLDPVDMLADVAWLETDGNKRYIEDSHGRKIFPENSGFATPLSQRKEIVEQNSTPFQSRPGSPERRTDAKLSKFKHFRSESEQYSDSAYAGTRHKLLEVTRLDDLNRLGHEHHILRARSRGRSDSSASESEPKRSRSLGKSAMIYDHDRSQDILEKQMSEMLAKEARERGSFTIPQDSIGSEKALSVEGSNQHGRSGTKGKKKHTSSTKYATSRWQPSRHRRADSTVFSDSSHQASVRASLEVPGTQRRLSLEELDSTAPNSPDSRPSRRTDDWVPSIGMDLSTPPPKSRQPSPSHDPLGHVKSRINKFRERSREPKKDSGIRRESTASKEYEQISDADILPSDRLKLNNSKTDESTDINRDNKRAEESSGFRGLFRSGRNNVSKVGEMFRTKEPNSVPTFEISSGESDSEDDRGKIQQTKYITSSNADVNAEAPLQRGRKPLDLPVFRSPFEDRGRSTKAQGDNPVDPKDNTAQSALESGLLRPPRIDVQDTSTSSSPDFPPMEQVSSRLSSISDIDRRRSSGVECADARLNAILGTPGAIVHAGGPTGLFVTGLAGLELRRPSLADKRQWSISDSTSRDIVPISITRQEIARIRVLLLTSGVKADEIARRAEKMQTLDGLTNRKESEQKLFAEIVALNRDHHLQLHPVARAREHMLAAKILSNDIRLSSSMWQQSAETFSNTTVANLLDRVGDLQHKMIGPGGFSDVGRKAADDADELARNLVETQILNVKALTNKMDSIIRRRRRQFWWLRRGGWVIVEWILVGVMWWVWLTVVLIRIVKAVIRGVVRCLRWLLWL